MNIKHYLFFALLSISILSACTKEEDPEQAPVVDMAIKNNPINSKVNEKITFSAINVNNKVYSEEWKLEGEVKSTSSFYNFTPVKAGIYNIEYTATNNIGAFNYKYVVNVGVPTVPSNPGSNKYVTKVFEYLPAPGQYTNKTIGTLEGAKSIEGKEGIVSLGAWGGYIVLGFDHTVINESQNGTPKDDIIIYGNAQSNWAEPGVVWVMQDENGNGKPDDTWYELKGSEFGKDGYIRDYEVTYTKPATGGSVTWKDNKGKTGVVTIAGATSQAFPSWVTGTEYTLKGTLLPSSGIKAETPTYITSAPFTFGYGDNKVGGDNIDIANAIDKDGKTVTLTGIDFIKIQTGIQADLGWLGELSTEVLGVADLNLVK